MAAPIGKKGETAVGRGRLALAVALVVGFGWAYGPTLLRLLAKWSNDPHYSHGFLVPLFSAYLLYARRKMAGNATRSGNLGALVFIAVGATLKICGALFYVDWLDAVSLLPTLCGIAVLLGGWPALRWSWPAIGFLFFMIPLPFRIERSLGWPLQVIATRASTYVLQTCGLAALADGNVIHMSHGDVGVVEACSGMGILLLFFAVSTAVAIVIRRPLFDRVFIVLCAVPIAILSNIVRISMTGVLHETVGERIANLVFHDFAGWLMMPLALVLLAVVLWFLRRAIEWYPVESERDALRDSLVPSR
jgi:exosortase